MRFCRVMKQFVYGSRRLWNKGVLNVLDGRYNSVSLGRNVRAF